LRSAVVGSWAKLPERENTTFGMAFIGAASGSVEVGRPVTHHVGVRSPPGKMCAGFPQL
jgi:hypothetical protein